MTAIFLSRLWRNSVLQCSRYGEGRQWIYIFLPLHHLDFLVDLDKIRRRRCPQKMLRVLLRAVKIGTMDVTVNLRAKRVSILSTFVVRFLSTSVSDMFTLYCWPSVSLARIGRGKAVLRCVYEWYNICGYTAKPYDGLQVKNALVTYAHYVTQCAAYSPINRR